MKIYHIRDLATKDLKVTLKDNFEALENYRFQHASGQLENFKALANTKRDIARILTVLKEREKEEQKNSKKN
ncbi:MAG: 50S ribosomal protein L29 [Ignavibacteriae bacterium]|nr:50S ribosomal protein L29 [Ignavibacteriota bacterium]